MDDFLVVDGLTTHYLTEKGTVEAVQNVSFAIRKGESIGIAGESACGKSTLGLSLMRTIMGGRIASGKILLDGASILEIPENEFDRIYRWKKISMIFQGAMNSLDPVYTIHGQFLDILKEHTQEEGHYEKIKSSLQSVGLNEDVLKKYPHELSGGMKQRVVIAMALLLKPQLVIADEPTTALDVLTQSQILNLFKSLKKEGISFMLISHDLATISEVCEKIGIMYGGKIIEFGDSSEIFQNPKHPYTKALIKSIPKLKGDTKPQFIPGKPPALINPTSQCRFIDRCPEAIEKCKQDPPKIKTDSGYVLCWLYE